MILELCYIISAGLQYLASAAQKGSNAPVVALRVQKFFNKLSLSKQTQGRIGRCVQRQVTIETYSMKSAMGTELQNV